MLENKWNVRGKFQINRFKGTTFSLVFMEDANFLKCFDKSWDTIFDSPLIISRVSPEVLYEEAYDSIPQ